MHRPTAGTVAKDKNKSNAAVLLSRIAYKQHSRKNPVKTTHIQKKTFITIDFALLGEYLI